VQGWPVKSAPRPSYLCTHVPYISTLTSCGARSCSPD